MRIRLLTDRVSGLGIFTQGDVVDIEHEEALRMIAAGQAEGLDGEMAVRAPRHQAVRPRAAASRR